MRIAIHTLEDQSNDLIISDLSDAERRAFGADPEVLVVGLEQQGDRYHRVFPAGTPYLEACVDNLRRWHAEILEQTRPGGVTGWRTAVDLVLKRLAGSGIEWLFIGGAALAVQGVQITPGDVDLITNVAGAKTMNDLFSDCLITPAAPLTGQGTFGRAYHGAKVEWVGNDPGENPHMWNLAAPQRIVSWQGFEVRVALLETYLRIEQKRGRADRVSAIEAVLSSSNGARNVA